MSLHFYCSPRVGRQSFIVFTHGFHVTDATVGIRIDDSAPIYVKLQPAHPSLDTLMSTNRGLLAALAKRVASAHSIFVRVESEFAPREESNFQPVKQDALLQLARHCAFRGPAAGTVGRRGRLSPN